jgi:uncharacterized membrane-anchored protein YhcB (DUF1043 family)
MVIRNNRGAAGAGRWQFRAFKWALMLMLGLAAYVVVGWYFNHVGPLPTNRGQLGQFGDFIGGSLNPLLSFMAVVGLLVAIALQSEQLRLSREELRAAREELEASRRAQQALADTARQQLQDHRQAQAELLKIYRAQWIATTEAGQAQKLAAEAQREQAVAAAAAARAQALQAELTFLTGELHRSGALGGLSPADRDAAGHRVARLKIALSSLNVDNGNDAASAEGSWAVTRPMA